MGASGFLFKFFTFKFTRFNEVIYLDDSTSDLMEVDFTQHVHSLKHKNMIVILVSCFSNENLCTYTFNPGSTGRRKYRIRPYI